MAQSKIILDTNSYFRLAQSIHPLLFVEFGIPKYCLYVTPELDVELNRSPKLQTKFSWASEEEFASNRRRHPSLSRSDKKAVSDAYDFLWDHVQNQLPGPSRIDARNLAYGFVLRVPVVTDDRDMRELAAVFDIKTMSSLELMRLMCNCAHISTTKARQVYEYWKYLDDLPFNSHADFACLFPPD
jgi:hypothetical protein